MGRKASTRTQAVQAESRARAARFWSDAVRRGRRVRAGPGPALRLEAYDPDTGRAVCAREDGELVLLPPRAELELS